jgi:hypothetical protein
MDKLSEAKKILVGAEWISGGGEPIVSVNQTNGLLYASVSTARDADGVIDILGALSRAASARSAAVKVSVNIKCSRASSLERQMRLYRSIDNTVSNRAHTKN